MDFKQAIKAYAQMMGVSESEAREDAERTIKAWMEHDHMTREFAEASWIEEQEDADPELLKQMEKRAKESGATKVKAQRTPANYSLEGKPKRERKPNEDKRALIALLASCLEDCHRHDEDEIASGVADVQTVNPERQVDFHLNGVHYSVTLTAHRKPKEKGKA